MIRIFYWAMVIALSSGLVGAFALGLGAPVPPSLVIAFICVGTAAMVAVIVALIAAAKTTTGDRA